jgi:hypothetical protein
MYFALSVDQALPRPEGGPRIERRAFGRERSKAILADQIKRVLAKSMPMTAISLLSFWDMACSFALGAPRRLGPLAGLEHGRTIPLAEVAVGGSWSGMLKTAHEAELR